MSRSNARLRPAIFLLIVLTLSLAGCSLFAPPEGGDPPPPSGSYRERTTPENVIHNLVRSYERMEADEYVDCLADTFTFWLNEDDVIADPTLPWYWDRQTESDIAYAMFGEGTNILSIQLTLTQFGDAVEIPAQDPQDPSSWQYVESVLLWVYLSDPPDLRLKAEAPSRFKFSIDPNETGPNGETLWEIAKWEDIDVEGRPIVDDDYVAVSVSELKAMFRE
jgi:hypothetical protein